MRATTFRSGGNLLRWAALACAPLLGLGCGSDSKPTPSTVDGAVADAGKDGGQPDVPGNEAGSPGSTTYALTILHTNDLHAHLMGHSPEADYTPATPNDDTTVGGFARLATALGQQHASAAAEQRAVLTLDAGDFLMGTLFSLLDTTAAPELRFMNSLGFDATTVGNHELDWAPQGLAAILATAKANDVTLPILDTNLVFSATDPGDDELAAMQDVGELKRKLVKVLPGGLKVGIFGLLGKGAAQVSAAAAPLTFNDTAATSLAMVTELRTVDKVDLVIALSHSGISAAGTGEDQVLASMVPGIDVIVSGHTHEKLAQPVTVGKTLIVTAGAYAENLGRLDLDIKKTGDVVTVTMKNYKLIPIDDSITGNTDAQNGVDLAIAGLDSALAPAGLTYKKVVAKTAFDLTTPAFQETTVGDLVADAYRTVANALSPTEPVDIAVEANGQIRTPILKGKTGAIWFADLFRITPFGIGFDAKPGIPLVTYYLSGKDLKNGMELSAGSPTAPISNNDFFFQLSGMKMEYKPTNPLFGRVTGLWQLGAGASLTPIDVTNDTHCYKVVSTYYVASLFGLVKTLTGGALSVTAKEKDCTTPVASLQTHILDLDPTMAGVQELKQYQAVLGYVQKFPDADADGTPDVPALLYQQTQGRITVAP